MKISSVFTLKEVHTYDGDIYFRNMYGEWFELNDGFQEIDDWQELEELYQEYINEN